MRHIMSAGWIDPRNEMACPDMNTTVVSWCLYSACNNMKRVINTLPSLSSHNTFIRWMQSRVLVSWIQLRLLLRLHLRLCPQLGQPQSQHRPQLCLWYLRIPPASQISSSECSSLEDQMREKHPSYKGSATQQRVQKSIGLIRRALANRYVLIPNTAFDLMVYPG